MNFDEIKELCVELIALAQRHDLLPTDDSVYEELAEMCYATPEEIEAELF